MKALRSSAKIMILIGELRLGRKKKKRKKESTPNEKEGWARALEYGIFQDKRVFGSCYILPLLCPTPLFSISTSSFSPPFLSLSLHFYVREPRRVSKDYPSAIPAIKQQMTTSLLRPFRKKSKKKKKKNTTHKKVRCSYINLQQPP